MGKFWITLSRRAKQAQSSLADTSTQPQAVTQAWIIGQSVFHSVSDPDSWCVKWCRSFHANAEEDGKKWTLRCEERQRGEGEQARWVSRLKCSICVTHHQWMERWACYSTRAKLLQPLQNVVTWKMPCAISLLDMRQDSIEKNKHWFFFLAPSSFIHLFLFSGCLQQSGRLHNWLL